MIVDLIYVIAPSERTMQVAIAHDDGRTERLGPVPSTGAFGPLGVALAQLLPESYADAATATLALTTLHFVCMIKGANVLGQPYPHRVGGAA